MRDSRRTSLTSLREGSRDGIAAGLRAALSGVTGEPLPMQHVELLLALRRREREQAGPRKG